MSAAVTYLSNGRLEVKFGYNLAFKEQLKADVPSFAREWDEPNKRWLIDVAWADVVFRLLNAAYDDVRVTDLRPKSNAIAIDPDYATLYLLPGAPPEAIPVMYRVLSKIHHPDRGGNQREMQKINAAYSALQARGAV